MRDPSAAHSTEFIIPLFDCPCFPSAVPGVFLPNPSRCYDIYTFLAGLMRTVSMFLDLPSQLLCDNYLFNRRTLETGVYFIGLS